MFVDLNFLFHKMQNHNSNLGAWIIFSGYFNNCCLLEHFYMIYGLFVFHFALFHDIFLWVVYELDFIEDTCALAALLCMQFKHSQAPH